MIDKIAVFLINLIPIKKCRKKLREYFSEDYKNYNRKIKLQEKQNSQKFFSHKVPDKSILIVEPNPYHAEILPSFVSYFQELGYTVDLLLRHENNVLDIFSKFIHIPKTFYGTPKHLKKMLNSSNIKNYEYVFFSSSAYWESGVSFDSYLNYLGFIPKAKNGILMVEHNIVPYLKKYKEEEYLQENRLFSCSGLLNVPVLSPCYFGNIKIKNRNIEKTTFIVVGAIDQNCKNFELLKNTVSELIKDWYKNFEIIIDGAGELNLSNELSQYIFHKGRVSFETMFNDVENSDFILYLLDPNKQSHDRYKQGTTSGTLNLQLGFSVPGIIEESFAKAYNLSNENSIIYKDDDLYSAMKKAIEQNKEDYLNMQNNIKIMQKKLYEKSLNNLRKAIKTNAK